MRGIILKKNIPSKNCRVFFFNKTSSTLRNYRRIEYASLTVLRQSDFRMTLKWRLNENSRTKQKQQTNENRAIWLVYQTDTNAHGFWLVRRTLWWQKLHAWELSRNQPILRFDVIMQHDWPIEQCPLHIRVFFGGKTKRACFDLFISWLIKTITNNYRNYFSNARSHENRSIFAFPAK